MKTIIAAVVLVCAIVGAQAQDLGAGNYGAARKAAAAKEAPAKPASKTKSYPFHGTLDSVNGDGTSLTLRGKTKQRVIMVSPRTRILRGETKATLKQAIPGERITGSVFRNDDGKEQALTVRLGGKQVKSRE